MTPVGPVTLNPRAARPVTYLRRSLGRFVGLVGWRRFRSRPGSAPSRYAHGPGLRNRPSSVITKSRSPGLSQQRSHCHLFHPVPFFLGSGCGPTLDASTKSLPLGTRSNLIIQVARMRAPAEIAVCSLTWRRPGKRNFRRCPCGGLQGCSRVRWPTGAGSRATLGRATPALRFERDCRGVPYILTGRGPESSELRWPPAERKAIGSSCIGIQAMLTRSNGGAV